ncbi:MAG: IS66 family insertion sequence element accessory protein TnpB [Synechococcales cyanobacterium CRU_2_2]|nr:IS66 family insertion sequence element accessory protein TnpB [Synechococcales cyanobacterium CRU_2_2]
MDSLAEIVRSFLGHDPLSGSLFVFRNKGASLVKVLWWDRDGLAIYYKRLEEGTFAWPKGNTPSVEIACEELLKLLSGLDYSGYATPSALVGSDFLYALDGVKVDLGRVKKVS